MFFFILRRPPGLSRTDPLLPYTPLFRSPKPVPRSRTGRREAVPHDHRCRLTTKDFNILQAMLEERRERDDPLVPLLREKLATAIVLPPQAVPADVVTLYSRVRYSIGGSPATTRIVIHDDAQDRKRSRLNSSH